MNDTMVRIVPEETVKELWHVLLRLLQFMQEGPGGEHILFSKIDLTNGYWRLIIEKESRWHFTYALPGPPGSLLWLVILSLLQMGWNKSLAYFCCATETTRDITQAGIDGDKPLQVHSIEPLTKLS